MKVLRGAGILLLHVPAACLPWCPLTWRHAVAFLLGYGLVAFALGGALHRYFAHRAFQTSRPVQLLLGLLAAACFADPIGFAGRHRHHHRWADSAHDRVGPRHGLWTAWIGHLLDDDYPERELIAATADLRRYPELRWLHRWSLVAGLTAIGLIWLAGGFTGLAVGYCLPLCLLGVHGTSAVNYVGHRFGPRRYATPDRSTNHPLLGFLLLGEGWHNNHHRFPGSARCGLAWWEIDPVHRGIRLLAALGLVWAVRDVPAAHRPPARRLAAARPAVASLLGLFVLSGCTGPVQALAPFTGTRPVDCPAEPRAYVDLTYTGAGGFLIRHHDPRTGDRAIMTGPFVSNPGLARSLLGFTIAPDRSRIDRLLPPMGDVTAILVGHAHYDHLMDAIDVAERSATGAVLYGNDTMKHIVNARPALRARVVSLEPFAGDDRTPGRWETLPGGGMRVMALRSEHAPQFLGVRAFAGEIDHDLSALPRSAYGWKGGQTLAFLIDVLDEAGAPLLRFHYQDAASAPPLGLPPPRTLAERPVDVALLCVASFDQVRDEQYPAPLLARLRPRHVVLAHWENFFSTATPPAPLPFLDTREFVRRLTEARPGQPWHTPSPVPASTVRFCLP